MNDPSKPQFVAPVTIRTQALQAALLVDVTAEAQRLHIPYPVAVTRDVWNRLVAVDDGVAPEHVGVPAGRLHTLLLEARCALRNRNVQQTGDIARFEPWRVSNDGKTIHPSLDAELGHDANGDLVITIHRS
jgi:hypothetical protein